MTMFGAAPNGASAGGRRGGFAAITPQALELEAPDLDLLLWHLALQLRMGISRHGARATAGAHPLPALRLLLPGRVG